jgi:hypothetical protein
MEVIGVDQISTLSLSTWDYERHTKYVCPESSITISLADGRPNTTTMNKDEDDDIGVLIYQHAKEKTRKQQQQQQCDNSWVQATYPVYNWKLPF